MKEDLKEIRWKGKVIGHVEDLKIDGFHAYGRWWPQESSDLDDFMTLVGNGDEDLMVQVGQAHPPWLCAVPEPPGQDIELLFRPDLNPPD